MSGPIRQPLADVALVTPTLNDKAVTIQNNTVRTSSYTAIYNLFKTGFDAAYLLLTGGTMSGNIDMANNQIKGLGDPSENGDAANKLYVDSQIGGASTLNDVLTNGNTSELDANIKTLGLFDEPNGAYGNVSLSDGVFEVKNAGGAKVITSEGTIFRITNFTVLETDLVTSEKIFTFPNIAGTFAMTSYADSVANDAYIGSKMYTDTQVGVKQDNYDLGNAASGTTSVTINATSGVATFTQVLNRRSSANFQINNTEIEAGDYVECNLSYDGAGYPLIMHYSTIANRIIIHIANVAVDGGSGIDTNANLVVTFRKI